MAKITVTPYTAGTVNDATNNKIANITDVPYQAGTMNHAMVNKSAKNNDTTFFWHVQWAPSTIQTKTD